MILDHFPDVICIYRFGTFGTKDQTKDSDLDLGILFDTSPSTVDMWNLTQEIASEINKDVDLIDLGKASIVFQFQIITTGKRLFSRNESLCEQFEAKIWPMYIRFNEERKEILQDFEKRYGPTG